MSTNMWNRENTTILIEAYRRHDCMWKTSSPFYRNKEKRKEALENIARALQDYRPKTKTEDVKNKINGIRTQFVAEINKSMSHKLGGGSYEPTLWCFEQLKFLKPYTQSKQKLYKVLESWKPEENNMDKFPPAKTSSEKQNQRENHISSTITSNYHHNTEPSQNLQIKAERDNDVEIIEESDSEDETKSLPILNSEVDQYILPINTTDITTNEVDQTRVQNLFTTGYSSELTLVPARELSKRKSVDMVESYEKSGSKEKTPKLEDFNHTEFSEDKVGIFGKFIMSQMRTVTDKVLYMKLEHTIQNAIIEAQVKQIAMDEAANNNKSV